MPNSSFKVDDLTAANSIVISTVTLSVFGGNLVLPPGTTVANVAIGSGGSASSFSYGNTAPVSPTIGSRWLDSDSGKEFIWVIAGATGVWMQAVGAGGGTSSTNTSSGGGSIVSWYMS